MKTRDDVDFAADPFGLIGNGAGKGAVKELLAEAANVDDEIVAAGESQVAESRAEIPGGGFVEYFEDELGFLMGDGSEIVVCGHGWNVLLRGGVRFMVACAG